ncbi:DUF1643 domain-containing protein [Clostridium fallax]|uniref:DUF1643 domain-containing protein n=1 Tax=Clostridium fallax TaxID=1533 RepID=A0A1M4T8G7_9CLOT|nr:DUF1643 domain-containing protein [Clostridium fallax]SHE40803.1 Protein of unknown function [Clostridium fallax]SQB22650.1 Uncharacterized protein conserved in bacteria [Clostridium fallax]
MIKGKFPKCIIKNSIETLIDHENNRCYKISFRMSRKGKSNILVIGRAPKRLDENCISKSIQRIIKYLNNKKELLGNIGKVTIVNLFTAYEYSRETLSDLFLEKGERFITGNDERYKENNFVIKNDEIIKDEIENADNIILAWGESLKEIDILYNNRVEYILKTIRQCDIESNYNKKICIVGDLTKKGYPRHCMSWMIKDELLDYKR